MSTPSGYEMYYKPCPMLIDIAKSVDPHSKRISQRESDFAMALDGVAKQDARSVYSGVGE